MDFLIKLIVNICTWIFGLFTWAVEQCWHLLCAGLALVLGALPVPSWLAGAGGVMGAMPAGVAYLAQAFMIPQGCAILVGAYTLRFVIRRIPLVG